MNENRPKHWRKAAGCCCGTPFLFVFCVFLLYAYNNRPSGIVVPTHTVPDDNGWNYIHQAYVLTQAMKHKSPYDMTGTLEHDFTLANFQECANDAIPALNMISEALKHTLVCPAIRFNQDYVRELRRNPEPRELARVNASAADYYAAIGNPGRAMEVRLNGLEMGVLIPRGGTTNDDMVGSACASISLQRIEPLVPLLDAKQLSSSAERLDRFNNERIPFGQVLLEEGFSGTAMLQEFLRDPKMGPPGSEISGVRVLVWMADTDPDVEHAGQFRKSLAEAKFIVSSKSAMIQSNLDWYAAAALEWDKPFVGASTVPVPDNGIAKTAAGVLESERIHHVAKDTEITILQAEIALYRFRATYNRFPKSLSDLCPQFLKSVPVDPFGGGPNLPLKYKLKPDGSFLLYSIGPDMKDDGGTPAKNADDMGGDIVAGKLYRNKPIIYGTQPKKQQ